MKLIVIPPYKTPVVKWETVSCELQDNMRRKGQLDGVEIEVAEGYPIEQAPDIRQRVSEEFFAYISVGIIKKVREYSEMGKHDAIVLEGAIEPGFLAARSISKIPVASAVHSAAHVASLIGNRFSVIHTIDQASSIVRRLVESYGLGHKLASVRPSGHFSTHMNQFVLQYKKEERRNVPEGKELIADMMAKCIEAIEEDRADTLILGCEPLQIMEDEIRQGLDEAGYGEIQLVCELSAAVEMAKAMVNMKLAQASRAYPTGLLKAKPRFR